MKICRGSGLVQLIYRDDAILLEVIIRGLSFHIQHEIMCPAGQPRRPGYSKTVTRYLQVTVFFFTYT